MTATAARRDANRCWVLDSRKQRLLRARIEGFSLFSRQRDRECVIDSGMPHDRKTHLPPPKVSAGLAARLAVRPLPCHPVLTRTACNFSGNFLPSKSGLAPIEYTLTLNCVMSVSESVSSRRKACSPKPALGDRPLMNAQVAAQLAEVFGVLASEKPTGKRR